MNKNTILWTFILLVIFITGGCVSREKYIPWWANEVRN